MKALSYRHGTSFTTIIEAVDRDEHSKVKSAVKSLINDKSKYDDEVVTETELKETMKRIVAATNYCVEEMQKLSISLVETAELLCSFMAK